MSNKKGLIIKIVVAGIVISIIAGILVVVDVNYNESIEKAKETTTKLEESKVKAKAEEQAIQNNKSTNQGFSATPSDSSDIRAEEETRAKEKAKAEEIARHKEQAIEEAVSSVHSFDPNDPAFQEEMRETMERVHKEMGEELKKQEERLNEQLAEEQLRQQIAEFRMK